MTPAIRSVIPLFESPSGEKIQHSAKKNRVVFRILVVTFTPGITNIVIGTKQSRKGLRAGSTICSMMVALGSGMLVVLCVRYPLEMAEGGLDRLPRTLPFVCWDAGYCCEEPFE